MTAIEWAQRPGTKGETLNPIRARDRATGKPGWFCEHVSEGCRNCYAETMNGWRGNRMAYLRQNRERVELQLDEKTLVRPLKWRAPRTIFWCSMTDLFADFVPDEWLDRLFAVAALTPQHTHQVLTKRPDRARDYFTRTRSRMGSETLGTYEHIYNEMGRFGKTGLTEPHPYRRAFPNGMPWPLPNVWLGTSVEDRARLARLNDLRQTPAALRFLSLEPLLQDLGSLDLTGIDWVIAGGESGPKARPAHPDWFRQVRDQCAAAGVPFFFKQWGAWRPADDAEIPDRFCDPNLQQFVCMCRNGFVGDLSAGSAFRHKPQNWPQCFPQGADGDADCNSLNLRRAGKRYAGRALDGVAHDAFPEPAP